MAGSFSGHLLDSYNTIPPHRPTFAPFGASSTTRDLSVHGPLSFLPTMHGTFQNYPTFGVPDTSNMTMEMSEATALKIAQLQAKLDKKLGPEYISTRPGPGGNTKLTYAEGWKIINLANEVFGFNGWSSSVVSLTVDFMDVQEGSGRVSAGVTAIVRVTLRDGVFHEDVGYGMSENGKSKAQSLDKCKKEAVTDGVKRALRSFGNLLGNCLYDKEYAKEIVKIKVPQPKFDKSQLHRRPEFAEPNTNSTVGPSGARMDPPTTTRLPVAPINAPPPVQRPQAPPQQHNCPVALAPIARADTEPAASPTDVVQPPSAPVGPQIRPVQPGSTHTSLFAGENSFDYTAEDLEMLDMAGMDNDEGLGGALVPFEEDEGVVDVDASSYTGMVVDSGKGKQTSNEVQAQHQPMGAPPELPRTSSGTGTAAGRTDRTKQIEQALREAEEERASASPNGSPADSSPQESIQAAQVPEPQQQRFQLQGAAAAKPANEAYQGATNPSTGGQQQRPVMFTGEFQFPLGVNPLNRARAPGRPSGAVLGMKRPADLMSGASSGFSNTRRPAQGMGLGHQPQQPLASGATMAVDGNDPKKLRR